MNGVIVAEPIVIADVNSNLLSITSTGSAKVVLTSSGVVQTIITNTPNVTVTNIPSVIVTSSGILPVSQSGTWDITNITGTVSLPTGAATSTGQVSTNSKLDILNSSSGLININLSNIDANIDYTNNQFDILNSSSGLVNTNLTTINSSITTTNTKIDLVNSKLDELNSSTGIVNNNLVEINNSIEAITGPVSPGIVALNSALVGGQYNSTLPTLTTSQQAALQIDYRGRIILSSTGATSVNQGIAAATAGAWPVKITDGTTVVGVSTYSEERVSDTVNHGGVNGAITVGTTAVEAKVGGSILTNRKLLTVFHNGNGKLYWGYSNAVTAANGTQLFKNTMVSFPVGDGTSVWLISDTAGQDVRLTEGA